MSALAAFCSVESGNDYAVNRYETPGTGRFLTPDRMNGTVADPGSWNKYSRLAWRRSGGKSGDPNSITLGNCE